MKQFVKILSILMLLFLTTAENCSNSDIQLKKQKLQQEQFQQIETDFLSDEITGEMLLAFNKNAIQKIKDLDDFISIYLDKNLPKEFREQAKNMVYKEFYSENDCRRFLNAMKLEENAEQCLLFQPEIEEKLFFKTDSVILFDEIQKNTILHYSGKIGFKAMLNKTLETDTVSLSSKQVILEILVVKTFKKFGNSTDNVWEIFLKTENSAIRNLYPETNAEKVIL